jgi:hypothetical protein
LEFAICGHMAILLLLPARASALSRRCQAKPTNFSSRNRYRANHPAFRLDFNRSGRNGARVVLTVCAITAMSMTQLQDQDWFYYVASLTSAGDGELLRKEVHLSASLRLCGREASYIVGCSCPGPRPLALPIKQLPGEWVKPVGEAAGLPTEESRCRNPVKVLPPPITTSQFR